MTGSTSRSYRSPLREEHARATRRAVVAAAHDLFVETGYVRTTIDAVAERAGVSRKTVFTAVGGKATLLRLAVDWALVGDDEPIPMADRPEIREQLAQTDPVALISVWARRLATIEARVARLALVMESAADADPEVAQVHADSERGRLGGAAAFVRQLQTLGALRADLDPKRATEIVGLLTEPLIFQRLVLRAGWPVEDYAAWLERTAAASLLPGAHPGL